MTRYWTQPGLARHTVLEASSSEPLVSAYALRRPDGRVSLLIVNNDPAHAYDMRLDLTLHGRPVAPSGDLGIYQLSSANYVWHPHGPRGYARPDRGATYLRVRGSVVALPPYSMTVVVAAAPR